MGQVSIFKNFSNHKGDVKLVTVLKVIKNGKFSERINQIRALVENDQYEKAGELKKLLPAFTVSGTFDEERKAAKLKAYSGFMVLDIDKLNKDELLEVKKSIESIPYTHSVFVSPGGRGLKVILKVSSDASSHEAVFLRAVSYYEKNVGITIDKSGKDVSRLCFFSFDTELFYKKDSEVFSINEPSLTVAKSLTDDGENFDTLLIEQAQFTSQKVKYEDGSRNNFVHQLACNLKRLEVPLTLTSRFILENYGYDQTEVKQTIISAYNSTEKESSAQPATPARSAHSARLEWLANPSFSNTPTFPSNIYRVLPDYLKRLCECFEEDRQKDMALLGALVLLSNCFPDVNTMYSQRYYSNLFGAVIAPAASGKGALSFVKMLGADLHYGIKGGLLDYLENGVFVYSLTNSLNSEEEGPKQSFFLPGDTSAAALRKNLRNNDGKGLIFETEIDTLSNAMGESWGSFDDMLRKGFEHEPINSSRSTTDTLVEVDLPKLSVLMSGTPDQFRNLIKSTENGLFSRIACYCFAKEPEWINMFESGQEKHKVIGDLSQELSEIFIYMQKYAFELKFKKSQTAFHFRYFTEQTLKYSGPGSQFDHSSLKRLGVICLRIAMVLTVLRCYQAKSAEKIVYCRTTDFIIAMNMIRVLIEHNKVASGLLGNTDNNLNTLKTTLLDSLPYKFRRSEADSIGANLGLGERTVNKYLRNYCELGLISKLKQGVYTKGTGAGRAEAAGHADHEGAAT